MGGRAVGDRAVPELEQPDGDGNGIIGSGSRHLLVPERAHRCHVRIPDSIEEFDSAEMVVTVGAATLVSQLTKITREHQLVPCGLQPDEAGTFGGVFSDPRESPCDPFTGRFRDHVLGIEGMRGDGASLLSGGRVVKNVTGYDLVRLLGGAMGALGVVTRLHLRLEREASNWSRIESSIEDATTYWKVLDSIRCLPIEPYLLAVEPQESRIQVILCGTQVSVEESQQLIQEILPSAETTAVSREDVVELHRQNRARVGQALRVRLPWSCWREMPNTIPGRWRAIFPSAGFGLLEELVPGPELDRFISRVVKWGGSVCAEDAIAEKNYQIPLVQPSPCDELTRRLRSEWDPQAMLAWAGDRC